MKIHNKIEELRDKLNQLSVSEYSLTRDNLIKLSQELDRLIHKYYEIYLPGELKLHVRVKKMKYSYGGNHYAKNIS